MKWYTIDEKVPGDELCLVTFRSEFFKFKARCYALATFRCPTRNDDIDIHWITDNGQRIDHVTHWMPLPEEPKVSK